MQLTTARNAYEAHMHAAHMHIVAATVSCSWRRQTASCPTETTSGRLSYAGAIVWASVGVRSPLTLWLETDVLG